MNPDYPQSPDDQMEARITALLLGELSPTEAEELRQAMEENSALKELHDQLQLTIEMVRQVVSPANEQQPEPHAPQQLSPERREKLLQHFRSISSPVLVKSGRREMPWYLPMGVAAAALFFVVSLGGLLPTFNPYSQEKSMDFSAKSDYGGDGAAPAAQSEDRSDFVWMWGEEEAPLTKLTPKSSTLGAAPQIASHRAPAQTSKRSDPAAVGFNLWDTRTGELISDGQFAAGTTLERDKKSLAKGIAMPAAPAVVPPPLRTAAPSQSRPAPAKPAPTAGASVAEDKVVLDSLSRLAESKQKPAEEGEAVSASALSNRGAGIVRGRGEVREGIEMESLERIPGTAPTVNGSTELLAGIEPETAGRRLYRSRMLLDDANGRSAGKDVLSDLTLQSQNALGEKVAKLQSESTRGKAPVREALQQAQSTSGGTSVKAPPPVPLLPPGSDLTVEQQMNQPMSRFARHRNGQAERGGERVGQPLEELPPIAIKGKAEVLPEEPMPLQTEEADRDFGTVALAVNESASKANAYSVDVGGHVDQQNALEQKSLTSLAGGDRMYFSGNFSRTKPDAVADSYGERLLQSRTNSDKYFFDDTAGSAPGATDKDALVDYEVLFETKTQPKQTKKLDLARIALPQGITEFSSPEPRDGPAKAGLKSATAAGPVAAVEMDLEPVAAATAPVKTGIVKKEGEALEDRAKKRPSSTAPIPQPEVQTVDNAFSTFSLNVADVSFKLAAAILEKGAMPEPATIRSEEFINAFDYRDPTPLPGQPIAFAWERARYPFAHNRDLLRFSVQTAARGREPGRPLNLVLLLDNSGSMERADRVRIIQECLLVLAAQLQPQDRVSVVTFARTARLWADGLPGNQAAQTFGRVGTLTPQGGTNLEEAMNLAYQTALRHYLPQGVNRVVILTDGAANLGNVDPAGLKQKVEAFRQQGVALDCFGIGWEGYNDDLLEVLSRNGDGRYGFVNSPEAAASEFAGQLAGALQVAASDVKVQVEFNPRRVTAYRQIGYAKHQLKKEQFRDNTVDAAEIGAAESGNALYVVQVDPNGQGPLAVVRVRYKQPGTRTYHEREWPVPYEGEAVPLERASAAMRLAASASAFSEWLVTSPHAAEVTPDRLLNYLRGVPAVYGADPRPKQLEWMIRQAQSIAGR